MGLLFFFLKARLKVGHGEKSFGYFLDRKTSKTIFQNRHTADAMLELSRLIDSVPDNKGIEVFWDKNIEHRWQSLFEDHPHSKKLMIGLNPGADNPNKRWDPKHYANVADRLIESLNADIILLGGPGEEKIANAIEARMSSPVINLAGKLTLDDLIYLISRLDLFLTNDSGPMHIAAAVHTPLVALFGPETPALFGPYAKKELYRVIYQELDCRPCGKKRCEHPLCLDLITPQDVYEKCLELLNR
jgi:lipopolysaccharide heptosyltransferase II